MDSNKHSVTFYFAYILAIQVIFVINFRTWLLLKPVLITSVFPFRYLVKFLAKLAQDSDVNKMSPSNLAIVLGPNLMWAKTEG